MSMMLQSSAPFVVASALLSDMVPLSAFFFSFFVSLVSLASAIQNDYCDECYLVV